MVDPRFRGARWLVAHTTIRRAGSTTLPCATPSRDPGLEPWPPAGSDILEVTPLGTIDFGPVSLRATVPVRRTVVLAAPPTGSVRVGFYGIDWPGGLFSYDSTVPGSCTNGQELSMGARCAIVVTFLPQRQGPDTAELLLHTSDRRRVTGVPLRGTGTP